nr:DUF4184 family protein [Acinetobacter sp. Marseille-Q1620]
MPFTLSHTVLAPPIAKLSGQRLPIAALAIGCMTPDLYRILSRTEITLNHQFKGIIYPDLFVGTIFCLLWYCLYRPVIYKVAGLQDTLKLYNFKKILTFSIMIILSIIIGTVTHIIWDGLTHSDFRTIAFHSFLQRPVTLFQYTFPMHRILQITSSVIALPFIFWMIYHYYLKHKTPQTTSIKTTRFGLVLLSLGIFFSYAFYVFIAKHTGFIPQHDDLYNVIGFFFKYFTQGALIFLTFGCLIFQILNSRAYFDK